MHTGITRIDSRHSVAQTMERLESLIKERDLTIFARIRLQRRSRAFGPRPAPEGHTQIAYNDPQYIIRRHGLDAALAATLAAVVPLIERAAHD
jgi:hypothetical protein